MSTTDIGFELKALFWTLDKLAKQVNSLADRLTGANTTPTEPGSVTGGEPQPVAAANTEPDPVAQPEAPKLYQVRETLTQVGLTHGSETVAKLIKAAGGTSFATIPPKNWPQLLAAANKLLAENQEPANA